MIKILVAGDFVPRFRVESRISKNKFEDFLGEVKALTYSSDFSIVNLEAPIISGDPTPIVKTGPNLFCTDKAVEALKWAGFDCVCLANNHFYDQGDSGVDGTLAACKLFDMLYVGGGKNLHDAEKTLYVVIDNKKVAIINCCEHEWSIATSNHGGANPINPIKQYYAIQEAKRNADYVLVIVHGGIEMYQYPTPRMQELYRFFVDAGADAVVNHHQHCYSGYEKYNGRPIFYGIGNFCFDANDTADGMWNYGYFVELLFDEAISYNIIPFVQCSNEASVHLLNPVEFDVFISKLAKINNVIVNEEYLAHSFLNYLESVKNQRMLRLEPFDNRILLALRHRKLFPSFFSGMNKLNWLNRLECESHRELLSSLIRKDIENGIV